MSKKELIDIYSLYESDKAFQDRVKKYAVNHEMSIMQVLELLINHLPCKVFCKRNRMEK